MEKRKEITFLFFQAKKLHKKKRPEGRLFEKILG
jgi:hypothetical protein